MFHFTPVVDYGTGATIYKYSDLLVAKVPNALRWKRDPPTCSLEEEAEKHTALYEVQTRCPAPEGVKPFPIRRPRHWLGAVEDVKMALVMERVGGINGEYLWCDEVDKVVEQLQQQIDHAWEKTKLTPCYFHRKNFFWHPTIQDVTLIDFESWFPSQEPYTVDYLKIMAGAYVRQ